MNAQRITRIIILALVLAPSLVSGQIAYPPWCCNVYNTYGSTVCRDPATNYLSYSKNYSPASGTFLSHPGGRWSVFQSYNDFLTMDVDYKTHANACSTEFVFSTTVSIGGYYSVVIGVTNSDLDVKWVQQIDFYLPPPSVNSQINAIVNDVKFCGNGDIMFCGKVWEQGSSAGYDLLGRLNSSGTLLWTDHYVPNLPSLQDDGLFALIETGGNIMAVGNSEKANTGGNIKGYALLADGGGTFLDMKVWNNTSDHFKYCDLVEIAADYVTTVGATHDGTNEEILVSTWEISPTSQLTLIDNRLIGNTTLTIDGRTATDIHEIGWSVINAVDNEVLIAGERYYVYPGAVGTTTYTDGLVVKLDKSMLLSNSGLNPIIWATVLETGPMNLNRQGPSNNLDALVPVKIAARNNPGYYSSSDYVMLTNVYPSVPSVVPTFFYLNDNGSLATLPFESESVASMETTDFVENDNANSDYLFTQKDPGTGYTDFDLQVKTGSSTFCMNDQEFDLDPLEIDYSSILLMTLLSNNTSSSTIAPDFSNNLPGLSFTETPICHDYCYWFGSPCEGPARNADDNSAEGTGMQFDVRQNADYQSKLSVNVTNNGNSEALKFQVFNSFGARVAEGEWLVPSGKSYMAVDGLQQLASGIYFLVISRDGQISAHKLLRP